MDKEERKLARLQKDIEAGKNVAFNKRPIETTRKRIEEYKVLHATAVSALGEPDEK